MSIAKHHNDFVAAVQEHSRVNIGFGEDHSRSILLSWRRYAETCNVVELYKAGGDWLVSESVSGQRPDG